MALNPIAYTENVVRSFLRYQLTAYPFADPHLHSQMRKLLSLDETRQSPLLKGLCVSLSRPFRQGASVASLVAEGLLHPHLGERIPLEITHLYSHQECAIRAIAEGRTTLVSTGTGSGKTECFLYPIISRCLALRDEEAPPGISAVIVYPVCTVCGQSVSPLSSERQRKEFREAHAERCRRPPEAVGFYADVTADALSLPACDDATTAYSVLEALRFGAARVLDMHMDDLQILVIGHVERDSVDAVLWDPMPGGSGLLNQLCEHFDEIVEAAHEIAKCPAVCGSSCVGCLQTFRNAYYHAHLDRAVARERLDAWGRRLSFDHDIPPLQPSAAPSENAVPVNDAEVKLRHLLLAAGFGEGVRGEQIRLDRSLGTVRSGAATGTERAHAVSGTTTPDVIYRTEDHDSDEGVCIYLDGMSAHLHGNPETAEQDREIRTSLRNRGYEVIEIPANELDDEDAMVRHFRRLASYLGMRDVRNRVRDDRSWFRRPTGAPVQPVRPLLRLVTPAAEARYVNCVPLVPLQAAAGAFGDPHAVPDESDWEWVEFETTRSLRPGMFVAQVVGKSMEPRIPDGAYCLFASPVTGTRQGRTVLVQLRDAVDPDTGERFTVKRYRSEKTDGEDGWRHVRILLEPVNPAFMPIELRTDDEGSVAVVAELVEVIGTEPPA